MKNALFRGALENNGQAFTPGFLPLLAARSALIFPRSAAALFHATDQIRVFSTPLDGGSPRKETLRDRLGEAVDAGQGVVNLLFVKVSAEAKSSTADDFDIATMERLW